MVLVQVAYLPEEETVACHRVIRPRASQDKSVVATEGRDHDRNRHDRGTCPGKDHIRGFGCDTVARWVLDGIPWQCGQVSDICAKVECDNEDRAERERQRDVA